MLKRMRTGWLAGSGALVLGLAVSGAAMAAPLASDTTAVVFVDLDGNGVDDACQETVIADATAAEAAFTAVDTDGDGAISVREAAHSTWTGGANCNHGGYVSGVANADRCATGDEGETDEESVAAAIEPLDEEAECEGDETDEDEADELDPADDEPCEVVVAPEPDPALDPTLANAHGAWVSWVAKSAAVGGPNCNHGGAVSEAAKKDHEAARAERDARKAEREAARELKAQERDAAKAARSSAKAGAKGKGKGH